MRSLLGVRSLLFSPGNVGKMLQKGLVSGVDVIVCDLEDSVALTAKENARQLVKEFIMEQRGRNKGPLLVPRVNSVESGLLDDDLDAVLWGEAPVSAINIGKIDSASMILKAIQRIDEVARAKGITAQLPVLPWIETAKGLSNVAEIATCSPRVVALCFGRDDFLADMGVDREHSGGFESSLCMYARSAIAVAAKRAKIASLDTPWIDIPDVSGE